MKKFLLKQKIVLLLGVISLFSLIIVGLVVFFSVSKVLVDNKKAEIVSSTTEQVHESILSFKNNQLFVYMLSTRNQVRECLLDHSEAKRSALSNIFLEYTNKEKKFLAVYLLDKNGIALVSTDPTFIGQDYSFRDYFKKAMSGESVVDFGLGVTSGELGYYFSEPVFSGNEIIGVMVAKVDKIDIDTPIISSVVSDDNVVMLTGEFGVILSSTIDDRILKSLGELTEEEKNKLKESNKFLGREIIPLQYDLVMHEIRNYQKPVVVSFEDKEDDDNEIISLVKIGELPFYIVVETRLDYLNSQIINIVILIILIFLFILLFLSVSIYYFLSIFIKPLNQFKLFFDNIGKGDLSEVLKIETTDEFNDMAISVNNMTKDLASLYKNLEEKVKERTKELEESQNKLQENLELSEKNNKMMINRELEMIKLKERIKELESKLPAN